MLWEPLEFPSYALGSAKAQVLKREVDKILEEGTLELVDHPGLCYYSWLFLVQMLEGGGGVP